MTWLSVEKPIGERTRKWPLITAKYCSKNLKTLWLLRKTSTGPVVDIILFQM